MKSILCLALTLLTILMGILYGPPVTIFIDMPTLVFVTVIPALALVSRFSMKEIASLNEEEA